MSSTHRFAFLALLLPLLAYAGSARALSLTDPLSNELPVSVSISGNTAIASVGPASAPLADLILTFDDASGLSAQSLGIRAELVSLTDSSLLARLPAGGLATLGTDFPVLISVEPPTLGGLSFRRTVTAEIHTHLLPYTAGSHYRLFKAPPGGDFDDITREILPGSVRARGTTGSFSQFLILTDLRASAAVIDGKIAGLRDRVAALPSSERTALESQLDAAELAVDEARYADAVAVLDAFSAHVSARAGVGIPQEWRATGDADNIAGALLAGAASLKFSIGYLRDYGF